MKFLKTVSFVISVALLLSTLAGCGISKNKYEALLNEKIALEEKLNLITKSRDAMRAEYENILKEKMDLATKAETAINEKSALKSEYDKLLDEKVALKAAYDKIAPGQTDKAEAPRAKTSKR